MQRTGVSVVEEGPVPCREEMGSDGHIIARSAAMRDVLARLTEVASTSVPVLIQGEIGAGKTTIGREIHRRSPFSARPFVRVECGALTEPELNERLFGKSGDCFQAEAARPAGLLGAGQCGTLYLDGITQLPLTVQIRMLGALQSTSGQYGQQDASLTRQVRVVASTTCDPQTAVAEKRFDSRLYYYLGFVRIDIPPLRHRQDDIRALVQHFLSAAVSMRDPPQDHSLWRFSADAWQCLLRYDWPGNVLELGVAITHAVMLAESPEIGQACVAGLLGKVCRPSDSETVSVPLSGSLQSMELALISEVVRRCRGNKAAAARALGLHRRTLYRLLEQ